MSDSTDRKTYAPLSSIRESDRNPRTISDEAVEEVRRSIELFGWRQPIVIASDGEIIAGHTRYRAAKLLELDEVWIERADDLTPEQVRAYRLADNRTNEYSGWDTGALAREVRDLGGMEIPGFSDEELSNLTLLDAAEDETDDDDVTVAVTEGQPLRGLKRTDRRRKLVALTYSGGKARYLDIIRALLPTDGIDVFIDAFGGGGSVIMNMGPYEIEIYNDTNADVVNFFKCLRNKPDELTQALQLTPYARDEFLASKAKLAAIHAGKETATDIERARLLYTIHNQSVYAYGHSWQPPGRDTSQTHTDIARVARFPTEFAARWKMIHIENKPALETIEEFDGDKTFFFVDPPYVHSARRDLDIYKDEMNDDDHRALAELLNRIKGRALLCSYRSELYDDLFRDWRRADTKVFSQMRKDTVTESFWLNY